VDFEIELRLLKECVHLRKNPSNPEYYPKE